MITNSKIAFKIIKNGFTIIINNLSKKNCIMVKEGKLRLRTDGHGHITGLYVEGIDDLLSKSVTR